MSDRVSIPRLERWALLVPSDGCFLAKPDHPVVVLTGVVSGDPRFPDGAAIVTSCVLALDPVRAVAHTRTSRYRLGKPSRVALGLPELDQHVFAFDPATLPQAGPERLPETSLCRL